MAKQAERKKQPVSRARGETEQAKNFLRPLQWLNRVLDALIEILESQLRSGAPVTPGTVNLLELIVEFKKRAMREGFEEWFPEQQERFIDWYLAWEKIDRELLRARSLAANREACQAALGRAERAKLDMLKLFPKFLGVYLHKWFNPLYGLDKLIERLLSEVVNETISQRELRRKVRLLRYYVDWLKGIAEDADDGGEGDEIRDTIDNMMERCRFLIREVFSGRWQIGNAEDRDKILRILRELRSQKLRCVRRLGDFGGTPVLDYYRDLFKLDFHVDNAADLWVDGRLLPEWDPRRVIRIIRRAERAKLRLIAKFPTYLGVNLAWFYDHLFRMDLLFDRAGDLLDADQLLTAIRALRHARDHKHAIEEVLETFL
jgi:hypothetical protein